MQPLPGGHCSHALSRIPTTPLSGGHTVSPIYRLRETAHRSTLARDSAPHTTSAPPGKAWPPP